MNKDEQYSAKKHTILVVDDECMVRETLRILLADYGRVITVGTGTDALHALGKMHVDIIISDIRLPDMTGLEVVARAKAKFRRIHIIILTGYATLETARTAINLGADAYLDKPFCADEITNLVQRLCTGESRPPVQNLVDYLTRENETLKVRLSENTQNTGNVKTYCTYLAHTMKGEFLNIGSSINRIRNLTTAKPDIQEECSVITESVELSQILLRRLIDYLGIAKPQLTTIPVGDLIDHLNALAEPRLPTTVSLEICVDEPARGQTLQANLEQLLGVLLELVHNAGKALRENGGTIQVTVITQQELVIMTIRDNGPGIPEEVRSRLFREQVTSKSGMGLGLYLCHKVIKSLGGELRLDSSSTSGTTIVINLPIATPGSEA